MKILRGIAILLAVLFIPAFAAAEDTQDAQEAESIMEVDYSGFQQVEPYIAYVKTTEPGGYANLRWAPSRDAALQYRMNDGCEVIVFAEGGDWMQAMDSESGYIGFVQSELLTKEEPKTADVTEAAEDIPFVDFDIKMDAIPEGYTFETKESGGNLYATFTPEDPAGVTVYVSVAYAPAFEGRTITSDLSEAELEEGWKKLTADYNDPIVEVRETEYGTALFVVTEGSAQSDYCDMVMVWKGYVFRINLQKATELTDEDLDIATQIASDMWVIEQ
ncbi:MAG: hypothetical protein IJ573_04265 [Clostridia bacterium]|nr:hypothetical protein [Clostridia bacterium]